MDMVTPLPSGIYFFVCFSEFLRDYRPELVVVALGTGVGRRPTTALSGETVLKVRSRTYLYFM